MERCTTCFKMRGKKKIRVVPHLHKVGAAGRSKLLGQRPFVLWFTGLSGSGKSTLAGEVEHRLHRAGFKTYLLDGDNVRTGINNDLGFSPSDRHENVRRVGEVARLMADAGLIVITALISPYRADREMARAMFGTKVFAEIYVNCPLDVCAARDVKGFYAKAVRGKIKDFTGMDVPYEVPLRPELEVRTDLLSVEEAVSAVLVFILPRIKMK